MRHFSILLLLPLMLGCSISSSNIDNDPYYSYKDIEDKIIENDDIFNQLLSKYLVYVYSETCGYCQQIKQQIISYAISDDHFFITEFSDKFVVSSYVEDTIGIKDFDHLKILGTPTLLCIQDGLLMLNISGKTNILSYLSIYIDN